MAEVLEDGLLHFTTRNADGGEHPQSIDVLILRLSCEECIDTHRLPTDERDCYKPTAAFLSDLAGRLTAMGISDCTPSIAYQLWIVSGREIERLKKNDNETPNSDFGSVSPPAE